VSYNASTVKIYNSTKSLVRFDNKISSFQFEKNDPAYNNCVAGVSSEVEGLALDIFKFENCRSRRKCRYLACFFVCRQSFPNQLPHYNKEQLDLHTYVAFCFACLQEANPMITALYIYSVLTKLNTFCKNTKLLVGCKFMYP
jgi:hypothetical protein